MAKQTRTPVLTPEFRLSFPNLFEPREYQGKSTFSMTMVFDKSVDLGPLKLAAKAALDEFFPNGCKNPRNPFSNGDDVTGEWGENFKGCTYVRAKSQFRPKVVDANLQEIIDPDKIYPGCYCRAVVVPYAYDNSGNRGVSFSIESVQLLRDGERIGGGGSGYLAMFDDGTTTAKKDDPFGDAF